MTATRFLIGAASAFLLAHSPSSLATISSSATLRNLTIQLFDLDESDGIAPSISFLSTSSQFSTSVAFVNVRNTRLATPDSEFTGTSDLGTNFFSPVGTSASTSTSAGVASVQSPSGTYVGTVLRAEGGSIGIDGDPAVFDFSEYQAFAFGSSRRLFDNQVFRLSPHTLAVFSAVADLRAKATVGLASIPNVGDRIETASAQAWLEVSDGFDLSGNQRDFEVKAVSAQATREVRFNDATGLFDTFVYVGQDSSLTNEVMSVSLSNDGNTEVGGYLTVYVRADGHTKIPAVPEPASYIMLSAGVSLLLMSRARRRSMPPRLR